LEAEKKGKYRKLVRWLLVDVAIASIIFALLFYKPASYAPFRPDSAGDDSRRVHPYLTYLSSELYNGIQQQKPFELVVLEEGINETIVQSKWPMESEGVRFSAPEILFVPDNIVLMGTAIIKGAEFVVTIELEPRIDEKGFLNLQVAKVKIGAMNITPLARTIAKKMYQNHLETVPIDIEDLRAKIAAALLNDEPFEPVFMFDGKKVRLLRINVKPGKLILHLVPA
jgi:hypothetical protein